jgi:nitroreductase
MNVSVALTQRRTIRGFKLNQISAELVRMIIEPALHAPSWANTQPWEIFVAAGMPLDRIRRAYAEMLRNCVPRNPDIAMPKEWPEACRLRMETLKTERAELLEACREPGSIPDLMQMNYRLFDAPTVAYLCMDRCLTPWSLFDLGALSHGIMLSAEEQGLGSAVAITLAAHPDIVRRELSIPSSLAIVIGIALGLPDPASPQNKFRSSRRPAAEVIRFVGFE